MVAMDVGNEDRINLHRRDMTLLEACLRPFPAVDQERAPTYQKYLGALMSSGGWLGRSRAQNRQSEVHALLTFLKLVLEGSELADVTKSGLLKVGVDLLDSLLGVVGLSGDLLDLGIVVGPHV